MQPFFLPSKWGQRFCLYHPPEDVARGVIIYLHPFAEEMNKARHMAVRQSRVMAEAGFAVLQIDFLGCGDSSGDFSDATWSAWQEDVLLAYRWLRTQSQAPLTLWGLRAGCLLAAYAAANITEDVNFIYWQPVVSGKQHWQQFARLKMAGNLASGQPKGVTEQLRRRLADGQILEIAGYTVSPALAFGLESAELLPPPTRTGRIAWFELSIREGATISPSSEKYLDQWHKAGFSLESCIVRGPSFWQTTEIEDVKELILATMKSLSTW